MKINHEYGCVHKRVKEHFLKNIYIKNFFIILNCCSYKS